MPRVYPYQGKLGKWKTQYSCSVERNKSNNMKLATVARKFAFSKKNFEVQINQGQCKQ
jgi:hypothetical protein